MKRVNDTSAFLNSWLKEQTETLSPISYSLRLRWANVKGKFSSIIYDFQCCLKSQDYNIFEIKGYDLKRIILQKLE